MTAQQPAKPFFKAPEQKPFKAAEPIPHEAPPPAAQPALQPAPTVPPSSEWAPIATAPDDPDARFWVRVTVNGKPVSGTDTLVRYRGSRKMVGGKWKPSLTIIDDKLGTKLGFRPTEWKAMDA